MQRRTFLQFSKKDDHSRIDTRYTLIFVIQWPSNIDIIGSIMQCRNDIATDCRVLLGTPTILYSEGYIDQTIRVSEVEIG